MATSSGRPSTTKRSQAGEATVKSLISATKTRWATNTLTSQDGTTMTHEEVEACSVREFEVASIRTQTEEPILKPKKAVTIFPQQEEAEALAGSTAARKTTSTRRTSTSLTSMRDRPRVDQEEEEAARDLPSRMIRCRNLTASTEIDRAAPLYSTRTSRSSRSMKFRSRTWAEAEVVETATLAEEEVVGTGLLLPRSANSQAASNKMPTKNGLTTGSKQSSILITLRPSLFQRKRNARSSRAIALVNSKIA